MGSNKRNIQSFGCFHLCGNVARYSTKTIVVGMAGLALRSPGNIGRVDIPKAKMEGSQGSVPIDMRSGSCREHSDDDVGQLSWFCCRS